MEPSYLFPRILLVLLISGLESEIASSTSGNQTDRIALLDFKNHITQDPFQIMPSWNDSKHFCNWVGVKCNPTNGRVMVLNLESQNLFGSIPPSIGNLTFLTGINLTDNNFQGEIPQEIGRLIRLQHLDLSYNSFSGKIPSNISQCRDLTIFRAPKNQLVGQIPEQLSSLSKLVFLGVESNNLSGIIPASIGNLSSLYVLSLMQNSLQGTLPEQIGLLSSLGFFQVSQNGILGMVPLSIYNISSLYYFNVVQNNLQGKLPPDVGHTLPNLEIFAGGLNNFTGPIPVSLSNATGLMLVDFAENSLTGTLPRSLGILQGLNHFNFDDNQLGNGKMGGLNFIDYLSNCTNLEVLRLARNQFAGELPNSIANLSTSLQTLTLGSNMLYGNIPNAIGNLVNLTLLGFEGNYLNGSIPDGFGTLRQLSGLYLNANRFSGPIPSSLGNLTSLTRLFMEENRLERSIPPSLGSCSKLLVMNLSSNNLSGTIPKEIIGLSSLSISLVLSNNSLTGSLPFEVGNLIHVMELDLSHNKLLGEIPSSLSRCLSLERLILGGNFLQGPIPKSLKALRGLRVFDFSRNNLSGRIPEFLGKLFLLKKLDLSFNNLEGQVPIEGIFGNFSAISIVGNNKLCGGISDLHLPLCSQVDKKSSRKFLAPNVVIPVTTSVSFCLLLCSLAACYVIRKSTKKSLAALSTDDWERGISYTELAMSTNRFSEENLIGSGSFGTVYKGILCDSAVVSVKVLNLERQGASKSFMDECNAFKNIRHRNILKIITTCSSVDQQGNDFKALVLEFMCNGSLEQWLHPGYDKQNQATTSLKIIQRLNIAVDVASALEYLHHHCEVPIVHCDLKPSNVLLDYDMTAHVGDFGLARFLIQEANDLSNEQNISVGLKGSIGYIAPENGMGSQVSTLGDVYSYGILLLEMFTGKRPTDDIFKDGLSICDFVSMGLLGRVREIVDRSLLLEEEEEEVDHDNRDGRMEERAIINDGGPQSSNARSTGMVLDCMVSVLRIGLSCSDSLPSERIPMNIVAKKMHAIRDSFLRFKKRNRR